MNRRVDDLIKELYPYLADVAALLGRPRQSFSLLKETEVPETAGLYVIYREDPFEVLYVGKARRRSKPSASNQPDGLRFRIMRNHLAYQGNDNFVRYLMEDIGLTSRSEARAYIRNECSVQWLEIEDSQRLFILEHQAIAATSPRYNRG